MDKIMDFFRTKTLGQLKIDKVFKNSTHLKTNKWFRPYDGTQAMQIVNELKSDGLSANDFLINEKALVSPIEYIISKVKKPRKLGKNYSDYMYPSADRIDQNILFLFFLMDALKDYEWASMGKSDLEIAKNWYKSLETAHNKKAEKVDDVVALRDAQMLGGSFGEEHDRWVKKFEALIEHASLKELALSGTSLNRVKQATL